MFQKLTAFTKKVSDLSDRPALTTSELKAQFDAAPDEVRQYLNNLIDALKSVASGDSGAKNIGVTTIPNVTGNNVQTILEGMAVEEGSNLNGKYVKYPNGTLICFAEWNFTNVPVTTALGSLFYSGGASTILSDYPVPFIDVPRVTFSTYNTQNLTTWVAGTTVGTKTSPPSINIIRPVSTTIALLSVQYIAIGRWK